MSRCHFQAAVADIRRWWGSAEGRDGYDAIEYLASQLWCNGNVGLVGNSWLAISQYFIAAEQPPHLKCIAPMEGASDNFRENLSRGGIAQPGFAKAVAHGMYGMSGLYCLRHFVSADNR